MNQKTFPKSFGKVFLIRLRKKRKNFEWGYKKTSKADRSDLSL